MTKEIECFITRNYYLLLGIAMKITKKDEETSRELLHEVFLQLYSRDNIKLRDTNDDSIKYYITSIMRVNFYSSTSPYYYRIRKERCLYSDLSDAFNMEAEQEEFEKQNIFDILEESYSELGWFHKALLDMYLTLGSLKKVSNKTNIPLTSISRYIKEARTDVINDMNRKLN